MNIDGTKMAELWAKTKKAKELVKFGGGFYAGLVKPEAPKPKAENNGIFVINGFYMDMRSSYVKEGASIHYYLVEWAAKDLSWADFRGKVLGGTDPETAAKDSLRNNILQKYE